MQTGYNILMGAGFAGELVDARSCLVESAVCEDTTLQFGLAVVAGADPINGVKVPASSSDVFRGIAAHQHKEQSYPFTTSNAAYAVNDMVNVLRKGKIFGVASKAVSANSAAYIVASGADAGKFTDSNSSTIATGGYFRSTIAAAGVVEIEINLP